MKTLSSGDKDEGRGRGLDDMTDDRIVDWMGIAAGGDAGCGEVTTKSEWGSE